MNEQPGREDAIVEAALELQEEARGAFLDQACAGDAALRKLVEGLLEVHERVGALPAPSLPRPSANPNPVPAETAEKASDHIGRYKLLQQIGEGGCGVVYMAEQQEPVRRRVALKVIKPGMDTRKVLARFEAERQALALMDHPNIAKVLDAGETETGRPYFVMELVRGIPITRCCDETSLTTEQRLRLFIQVCQAIQHAHQKGIIHRDIKPSNILVAEVDGAPVPKVIDFGIAKATTDQPLTDKTLFTAFEHFIGTPAYMSPEQARLSGVDIDTRSDIYGLGVLLYELLTGQTPFEPARLVEAGLDEVRRIIREEEPPRPSTRLHTLDPAKQTTVAKCRQTDAPKLVHRIRGDLDWIVMKCLEKERARRYETANGLARDIQRHLENEPVTARPPSRLYEFQKTVRRHKVGFAALAVVVFALALALGISTWSLAKEKAARLRALAAEAKQSGLREQAQSEAAKSRQVAQFLKDTLEVLPALSALSTNAATPGTNRAGEPAGSSNDFAAKVRKRLEEISQRLTHDFTNQPQNEIELRTTLAGVYHEAGLFELMEQMARDALQVSRSRPGEQDPAVANSLMLVGDALMHLGRFDQAEAAAREALALQTKLSGPDSPAAVGCLNLVGIILQRSGRFEEAESAFTNTLASTRKRLGDLSLETVGLLENVALTHGAQGRFQRSEPLLKQAEAELRQVLALRRQLLPDDHADLATSLNNLAQVLCDQGKLAEAESMCREALSRRRKQLGDEHPAVGTSLNNLASILSAQGRLTEAEAAFQEALNMRRKRYGEQHPAVAQSLHGLADVWWRQGKLVEAEEGFERALAIRRTMLGALHPEVLESLRSLLEVLAAEGKYERGEALLRELITPELETEPRGVRLRQVRDGWNARHRR